MVAEELLARGRGASRPVPWNAVDFLNPPPVYPGAVGQGLSQAPFFHVSYVWNLKASS